MRAARMFAAALVAVGVGAGLGLTTPAFAGAAASTGFEFGLMPVSVAHPPSLTNPSVTVGGTLLNTQNGNAEVGLPDEPVTIVEQVAGTGPEVTVAQLQTDSDGNFSVTLDPIAAGGIFTAEFAGDPSNGYAGSTSSPARVVPAGSSPTVTFKSPGKSALTVDAGTAVTFAGRAYVPDGATSIPLAGATATMYMNGNPTSVHTTLAKDGSFSLSVKQGWSADWYVTIDSAEPWPYSLYLGGAIVGNTRITVLHVFQTRVQTLTVPAKHEVHSLFKIAGTAQVRDGSTWKAAPSVAVDYYDRSLPNGKWVLAGRGKTNTRGAFGWQARPAKLGHLAWQARVNAQRIGTTVYRESASASRDSFFVDRTYVNEMVALHLHGGTDLGAIVDDDSVADGVADAVNGVAKFYYRAKGSKTWHYLGSDRTDSDGAVGISLSGTVDGYFRIAFPAQGDFLGSSATRYSS
jgi:hypothetical protein